ncbi:prenyltransferase [Candidatus Methylospira mobilis]|uniref:prenyltransferase n=1 Tax=Candidatus Methylospira mobilis TaxID=1808979 RepID=UPI001884ABAB|nr:prenyltransferase [Candidatus Methylospira mobilis]WNV04785.1 prenyltransferase [Candidatus Methylospira mobilis]
MNQEVRLKWWQALNPAIYLISVLPGVAVWLLVLPSGNSLLALLGATLAVTLLQHAINLLNDEADWRLGADIEKSDSWVYVHHQNLGLVRLHGWLSFLGGTALGLAVLLWREHLDILIPAIPLVALGYLYNSGKRPLSYTCLGEWVTGLCYGPGVFGGLWLVTGQSANPGMLSGALAFGCLAVALLLAHQPTQMRTDRLAGKQSFAVRYGADITYRFVRILFFMFLLAWASALVFQQAGLVTTAIDILFSCVFFVVRLKKPPDSKYLLLSSSVLFLTLALIIRS